MRLDKFISLQSSLPSCNSGFHSSSGLLTQWSRYNINKCFEPKLAWERQRWAAGASRHCEPATPTGSCAGEEPPASGTRGQACRAWSCITGPIQSLLMPPSAWAFPQISVELLHVCSDVTWSSWKLHHPTARGCAPCLGSTAVAPGAGRAGRPLPAPATGVTAASPRAGESPAVAARESGANLCVQQVLHPNTRKCLAQLLLICLVCLFTYLLGRSCSWVSKD